MAAHAIGQRGSGGTSSLGLFGGGELAALCIENSFEYGVSLYDSSYVSLAEYLDVTLYTADGRVLDKVGKSGKFKHISDLRV